MTKPPKPPRTPIAEARNLGPLTAAEMQAIGIEYLDQIESMGWEECCIQYAEHFPHRANLNAFAAIIGAIEDQDWRDIDPVTKSAAKALIQKIKSGNY